MTSETKYQRSSNLLWSDVAGDVVALDPQAGLCFGLEDVSATVWHLLSNPQSADTLCAALLDQYEIDEDTCRQQIHTLLDDMVRNRLVDVVG